ncbi:MAG: hypothetical protein Q8O94_02585 [bacterium]|nr:hypothetical protein [bacterium]
MSQDFTYNTKYYDGKTFRQLSPKLEAFRTYVLADGTVLALFQGNRGANPAIDFKIKALFPGALRKPAPPPHMFWVVDLLLKIGQHRNEVREIVQFYIDFYASCNPFSSVQDRDSYQLQTVDQITKKYAHIEQSETLPLAYVAIVVELFCKNEKLTLGAYMFKNLLCTLRDFIDGKCNHTDVLKAAEPGYR